MLARHPAGRLVILAALGILPLTLAAASARPRRRTPTARGRRSRRRIAPSSRRGNSSGSPLPESGATTSWPTPGTRVGRRTTSSIRPGPTATARGPTAGAKAATPTATRATARPSARPRPARPCSSATARSACGSRAWACARPIPIRTAGGIPAAAWSTTASGTTAPTASGRTARRATHEGCTGTGRCSGPMPGFRISTDFGKTWTPSPLPPEKPLFPEPAKFMGAGQDRAAPHFVDFGKNMEHSPDGKAYLVGMGRRGERRRSRATPT